LRWNVLSVWNALAQGKPPPVPAAVASPGAVGIWRWDYKSHFRSLPDDEAQMLLAVHGGASFSEICEQFATTQGEAAAARAANLLRVWVDHGWLTGYSVNA
jgi:hypothetical protein